MAFNFKKNIVVGVSVTPEQGLEVAQIDFQTRTVLKYGARPLAFDNNRKEIADLDIFKEALQDLLFELQIPKGSEVVLSLPAAVFKVSDYPASLSEEQINNVIEEELSEINLFKETDPCFSAVRLPNSTIQFNKVAYTASPKAMIIEIAMQIKELGYTLVGIDTGVNSTLNALIYNDRVDVSPTTSWVMLLVENTCCRIISMQGRNFVDSFEERVSIGEVLGDAENYSTVVNAVNPIIKNLPSQCLYVVSKTSVISAKILAEKLIYNAQIIHQESNNYSSACFLTCADEVDTSVAKTMTLDVIGASIFREFEQYSNVRFNLFNASLGNIYLQEQPPVININGREVKLGLETMIPFSISIAVPVLAIMIVLIFIMNSTIGNYKTQIDEMKTEVATIQRSLDQHKDISTEVFDEGDEIRLGIVHNKSIFSYYQIVGTEIPKKLWLTSLKLGKYTVIEGQSYNLESVYSFFRNIKDYNPKSNIKLQSLGLATSSSISELAATGEFDSDSILTSMNADYYQFRISDAPYTPEAKGADDKKSGSSGLANGLEPLD